MCMRFDLGYLYFQILEDLSLLLLAVQEYLVQSFEVLVGLALEVL